MYGLPRNTDVSFIVHQRLIQACFGQNELILNFDGTEYVSILVTSAIGWISSEGKARKVNTSRDAASFVLGLVGALVVSVEILPEGTLGITFEGRQQIRLYDDSRQFESYTIQHAGKTIVV